MNISQRLWIMAGVMIIMLMALGGYANWATYTMTHQADEVSKMNELRGKISELMKFSVNNREQLMLALQHNPNDPSIANLHDHKVEKHLEAFKSGQQHSLQMLTEIKQNPQINQIADKAFVAFIDTRMKFKEAQTQIAQLISQGHYHQATEHLLKTVNPIFTQLEQDADTLNNRLMQHQMQLTQQSDALNDSVTIFLIIMSLSSIVVGLGMAWLAIRNVKNSIDQVGEAITASVINMHFETLLPHRSDEFSRLSKAINQLFTNLHQGFMETNRVISAMSMGDMSQRITNQYAGDLNELKQGINQSADAMSKVTTELSTAMNALKTGQFSIQINNSAKGIYGQLLTDVGQAMNNIDGIIKDINEIMHQMSLANFDARVHSSAQGELQTLKNNINQSMEQTAQVIRSIVQVVSAQAEGDLTADLPDGTYHGQFHDLKNAMSYSVERMKSSITKAIDTSNVVNEAALQVSQGSSNLSGRVQEQAAALEQTSATMNEMASAVQTNTANAQKVAELAHQVQHQTGAGVEVMQKTISAMQSIKASSNKIADIVTLIDGIAFQTNLLALNAAVEAARAGEHGRGFAVVAGEVRALAQKSADAAKDIKELITDSVIRIDAGTQLADKSGEMLSGITGSIEQVASMIEEIAHASNEQSTGIHQVNKAIIEIDKITQENAALVEQTTSAAESLSSEAHLLKDNMGHFKTGVVSHAHYHKKSTHTTPHSLSKGLPAPASASIHANEWQNF